LTVFNSLLFVKRSFGHFRSILQKQFSNILAKEVVVWFGLVWCLVGQLEFVVRHYSGDKVSAPVGVGFKTSQPVADLTWRLVKEGPTFLTLQG
jgi:hypothetical protein